MAHVITVVGAGGKTTYLKRLAQKYLSEGKRVAITTTTHIWPPSPRENYSAEKTGAGVLAADYYGRREASGKLSAPEDAEFEKICREYDVVLVEGDGSHCMPVKIPGEHEPVIPPGTDEIVVIMGAHAIGRRLDAVCQRWESEGRNRQDLPYDGREKVTRQMLREIAGICYVSPLRDKYPDTAIRFELSRIPDSNDRIAAVLMASGFGRRYGGNKLLAPVHGKPLYRNSLDNMRKALGDENIIVVTQYEEIQRDVSEQGISVVMNREAQEGIAASIRLGTGKALERGADAVMFFAADMPYLPAEEIRLFAAQFLGSGKTCGCMEYGSEHISTNPGAFRLKESAEKLLHLSGDRGAMRIMKQEPWNIYYYQIAPQYAMDIDQPVDE